jgi:hypothetical protein
MEFNEHGELQRHQQQWLDYALERYEDWSRSAPNAGDCPKGVVETAKTFRLRWYCASKETQKFHDWTIIEWRHAVSC